MKKVIVTEHGSYYGYNNVYKKLKFEGCAIALVGGVIRKAKVVRMAFEDYLRENIIIEDICPTIGAYYINKIKEVNAELYNYRMVQVALITLENHIQDYINEVDYYFYKEFNNLLKRSIKICDSIIIYRGGYKVSKNKKELDIAVDKFNTVLYSIQADKVLDIDTKKENQNEVIEEIRKEHFLACHMYYFLEMIKIYNAKIDNIYIQNLVKGFVLTAKGITNKIIKDLKSDEIFIKGEC